jgi:Ni/Fe-hydrogenase 1 B-type cytochrome subunit
MQPRIADSRHPHENLGPVVAVYVWPYPLRLIHWGMVISIGALSFTGYYIQNPFIVGQTNRPFLMGWFRFTHEAFAMILITLIVLRLYLFFRGNRWVQWRSFVPLRRDQWAEMREVLKFYFFIRPKPISKVGHNALAALSYLVIYTLLLVEIVTGLVMYQWLQHGPVLGFFVGWIPRVISLPNLRLIHFLLMFVFIAFAIQHVHISMLISRQEKRGLMDSIFTGYKVVPANDLEEDERAAGLRRA